MGLFATMPCSEVFRLKRALVSILLSLASAHGVDAGITCDSADEAVLAAYRRVAKKVHPDNGGTKKQFQRLQGASLPASQPLAPLARPIAHPPAPPARLAACAHIRTHARAQTSKQELRASRRQSVLRPGSVMGDAQ